MDFVVVGALGEVDGIGAGGVEEVVLSDRVGDGEEAVVGKGAHPTTLVVAED